MPVSLDFETRSKFDVRKVGPRKHAEHAEVICMAAAVDDGPVFIWWPGDPFPKEFSEAVDFHAFNAGFERAIWEHCCARLYGWPEVPPPMSWTDTQARAALAGLPLGLGECATALGLPQDKQKDAAGKLLIRALCHPNQKGEYNKDPEKIAQLAAYCMQDVEVERAIGRGLPPLTLRERQIWSLTETMNNEGLPMDVPGVAGALAYIERANAKLNARLQKITRGEVKTASQIACLMSWVNRQTGGTVENLQKDTVAGLLESAELDQDVAEVLRIRQAVGLSSLKKFKAADLRLCRDGRVKDTLRYHGAATGRWSGVGIQPQNLKRPDISPGDAERALEAVAKYKTIRGRAYLDGLTQLSDCVRGTIKAAPGHILVAGDYAQIELRVLLWLAEDAGNLKELRKGLDPYKTMATEIYGTPYDQVPAGERQVAKSAVLGCGYSLGAKTFGNTYAKGMGLDLTEAEAELIVAAYRTKYQKVVSFWYALGDTVQKAIRKPGETFQCRKIFCHVYKNRRWLEIMLPSGRPLRYFRPHIEPEVVKPWGLTDETRFWGRDTYTGRWCVQSTYGGKLVENVTQAAARDILAAGMLRAEAAGLNPVMTVHDETVCHPCIFQGDGAEELETLTRCMEKTPAWAKGIPLVVEGWAGPRYRK